MNVDKIIKVSKRRGLDGVAIVDHNTIAGGLKGVNINKYDDFIVIPGSEIASDKGDIIGLFLNEDVMPRSASEVIEDIRSQGGISILAHPGKRHKFDEELLGMVDGIEVFNARSITYKNNLAQNFATEHNLPITAGSDAHFYFEIGKGFCVIETDVSSEEDLKKLILTGKCNVIGNETNLCAEALSQTIRMIKTRQLNAIPYVTSGFTRALFSTLKKTIERTI